MKQQPLPASALVVAVFAATIVFIGGAPRAVAQASGRPVATVDWTGAVDSNWLNPANWSSGAIPGSSDRVQWLATGTSRNLVLSSASASSVSYKIGGFAVTPSTGVANIALQSTGGGWLDLELDGPGFYSYNSNNYDIPYNLTLGDHTRITVTAATGNWLTARGGGFWGAKVSMQTGSEIHFIEGLASPNIYSLHSEQGTLVTFGNTESTISYSSVISGTLYSTRAGGNALRFGEGDGDVIVIGTTGVVEFANRDSAEIYSRVNRGTLLINGIHNGSVSTIGDRRGYIGGTGRINGNVVLENTGRLGGGGTTIDTAGTLTVNGDVTLRNGGMLDFYFFDNSTWNQLIIAGNLAIESGGQLSVGIGAGSEFALRAAEYKVATITGAITGDFSNWNQNAFSLTSIAEYEFRPAAGSETEIWISIDRAPFASVSGLTANQFGIARIVDDAMDIIPDELILSLDAQVTARAYGQVLNQLGPQAYQAWWPAALISASALGESVSHRLSVSGAGDAASKKFNVWTQASRSESTVSTTANNEYFNFKPYDFYLGADRAFARICCRCRPILQLHRLSPDDSGSSGDSSSITGALYARFRKAAFQLDALAFYGMDDYSADRSVVRSRLGSYAKADTDGKHSGFRFQLAYNIPTPILDIAPVVAVAYTKWHADPFTETGDTLVPIHVEKQSAEAVLLSAGFRFSRTFDILRGKAQIRPFLNVFYMHDAEGGDRHIRANVLDRDIEVLARRLDRDGWRIEGGFSVDYTNGFSLFASYGNDSNIIVDQTISVRAGVGYRF
ncbi:autotransporter domain-containing protein [Termitidicoccus mucosus]|uniref:autotransporter outer membrane beta-barrel domain-containing protein n=1 Tax=Termitidicoccus mucosus TaxID=1184151 RepID=UPI0031844B70